MGKCKAQYKGLIPSSQQVRLGASSRLTLIQHGLHSAAHPPSISLLKCRGAPSDHSPNPFHFSIFLSHPCSQCVKLQMVLLGVWRLALPCRPSYTSVSKLLRNTPVVQLCRVRLLVTSTDLAHSLGTEGFLRLADSPASLVALQGS